MCDSLDLSAELLQLASSLKSGLLDFPEIIPQFGALPHTNSALLVEHANPLTGLIDESLELAFLALTLLEFTAQLVVGGSYEFPRSNLVAQLSLELVDFFAVQLDALVKLSSTSIRLEKVAANVISHVLDHFELCFQLVAFTDR